MLGLPPIRGGVEIVSSGYLHHFDRAIASVVAFTLNETGNGERSYDHLKPEIEKGENLRPDLMQLEDVHKEWESI